MKDGFFVDKLLVQVREILADLSPLFGGWQRRLYAQIEQSKTIRFRPGTLWTHGPSLTNIDQ